MIQSKAAVFQGLTILSSTTYAFAQSQIVRGQSIGQIRLGEPLHSVDLKRGKADKSDGATGSFWETWFSKSDRNSGNEFNVYAVRTSKDVTAHVREIRVTYPAFSTANGVSSRSSSALIRRKFPHIRLSGYYQKKEKRVDIYDDIKSGIAFDISHGSRQCIAISVHRAGEKATQLFAPLGFKPIRQ